MITAINLKVTYEISLSTATLFCIPHNATESCISRRTVGAIIIELQFTVKNVGLWLRYEETIRL